MLKLGVSPEAFDAVVTSGDVTIGLMEEQPGDQVLHIGPARDLSLFDAAAEATGARPKLVSLEDAQYALCTGLRNDDIETAEDYEAELRAMASRGMTMICANPDIVIHRGDTLIYCAGALARRYEELGGSVIYAGKPYAPIYDRALALAGRVRGAPVEKRRVLAIGDGMRTDIIGARERAWTRSSSPAASIGPCTKRAWRRRPIRLSCKRLYDENDVGRSRDPDASAVDGLGTISAPFGCVVAAP